MNKEEQNGKTREEFLAEMPSLTDWVEKMEGFYGPLERIASLKLDGGRIIIGAHFERIWHWNFVNPANEKGQDAISVNLSPEAMCTMLGMFECLSNQAQRDIDWEKTIASMRKADEEKEVEDGEQEES